MAGPPAKTDADANGRSSLWQLQWVLSRPPYRFNATTFAMRICQHLIVYAGILISAVYGCSFILAPSQTALLSVILMSLIGVITLLLSSPRKRLRRLLEGGLVVSYIVGIALLIKTSEFIANILLMFRG